MHKQLFEMSSKNNWNEQKKSIPEDLITTKKKVFDLCGLECTTPIAETESSDYNAFRFRLNKKHICYRMAKITPTKTGQFVTVWKRNISGIIEPFDFSDEIDFVIISVKKNDLSGQFVFPKAVLLQKGIFSTAAKEGKRATRVYPPWDETTSKQAQKTQQWQLEYFYEITPNLDLNAFKKFIAKF